MNNVAWKKLSPILFLLTALLSSCGGGEAGSAPEPELTTVQGVVQLGYIAGGTVKVYSISNLNEPIATETTSLSTNINDAGQFSLKIPAIDDQAYYLLEVTGGHDIDSNDDGFIESTEKIALQGSVYAIVSGLELKSGVRVNALTDMAYLKVKSRLSSASFSDIKVALKQIASQYVYDIDGDDDVDNSDLLAFDPVQHNALVRKSYSDILSLYIPALHQNKSDNERVSSLLYVDPPIIKIDNGIIQEVPFLLNANVDNIPEELTIKWFLNGVEIELNTEISEAAEYNLSAKAFLSGELVSATSTTFSAIHTIAVKSIAATPSASSETYVTEEDGSELAGVKVTIPSGALKTDTTITIKQSSLGSIPGQINQPISSVLVMEPSGLSFDQPVTIRLPYSIDPGDSKVRIARYSNDGTLDYLAPIYIDREQKQIVFETDHFSIFQAETGWPLIDTADEKLVNFLNTNLTGNLSIKEWEPLLNSVVQSYADPNTSEIITVRVYDFAQTLYENNEINGFVNDSDYIAALRVLFPNDDSTGSKAVARWNEVKGGLSLISGISGFSIDKPIRGFIGLLGLPNDTTSLLDAINFPVYNPVKIGGEVIAKLNEDIRNGQISEFWPDFSTETEFTIKQDSNSLGQPLMQNLAVVYNRNKDFDLTSSIATLQEMVDTAKQDIANTSNPYSLITDVGFPRSVFIGATEINVAVSGNAYGYTDFTPKLCVRHKESGTKLKCSTVQYYGEKDDLDKDEFYVNLSFPAPAVTGVFNYQVSYTLNKTTHSENFSIESKNKTLVEIDGTYVSGLLINGGDYRFSISPTFKNDIKIDYTTVINIPGYKTFEGKYGNGYIPKAIMDTQDLSNIEVTFIPAEGTAIRADQKTYQVDLARYISDSLNNIDIDGRIFFFKWNAKYFLTGYGDLVTADHANRLTINKGDKLSFVVASQSASEFVYFDIDGNGKPNSTALEQSEQSVNYYQNTYYQTGLFNPSVRIKDKNSGKEFTYYTQPVLVVDSQAPEEIIPVELQVNNFSTEVKQDTQISINVLQSYLLEDQNKLAVSVMVLPRHGVVTLNTDETITYLPANGFTGTDTIRYRVFDQLGNSKDSAVTLIVTSTVPSSVAVESVTVTPVSLTLTVTNTSQLTATVSPANATNNSVSWSSSNNSVATVNSSGVVTAVGRGSATITVTSNDGGYQASTSITVSTAAIPALVTRIQQYERWFVNVDSSVVVSVLSGVENFQFSLDWGDGETLSFTVGGPLSHSYAAAGDYQVVMHVTDAAGQTDTQNITISVEAVATTLPPNIVDLIAIDTSSIGITWAQTGSSTFFRLYRSTSSQGVYAEIYAGANYGFTDTGLFSDPTISSTGLLSDTTYFYKVKGCIDSNVNTCSSLSDYASVKTARQGQRSELISSFTISQLSPIQGSTIQLSSTIFNPGSIAFDDKFQFAFILSNDAVLDAGDSALFQSGSTTFSLPVNTQDVYAYDYQVPNDLVTGNHYILACMVYVPAKDAATVSYCDPQVINVSSDTGVSGTIISGLASGSVTFQDTNGNTTSIPADAWVGITPTRFANDASNWNRLTCKIDQNGNFGNECYFDFDEAGLRAAFNDTSETFQLGVFKNHIEPLGTHWDCGENVYRFVGEYTVYGQWSSIVVQPNDFQDRSSEQCGNTGGGSSSGNNGYNLSGIVKNAPVTVPLTSTEISQIQSTVAFVYRDNNNLIADSIDAPEFLSSYVFDGAKTTFATTDFVNALSVNDLNGDVDLVTDPELLVYVQYHTQSLNQLTTEVAPQTFQTDLNISGFIQSASFGYAGISSYGPALEVMYVEGRLQAYIQYEGDRSPLFGSLCWIINAGVEQCFSADNSQFNNQEFIILSPNDFTQYSGNIVIDLVDKNDGRTASISTSQSALDTSVNQMPQLVGSNLSLADDGMLIMTISGGTERVSNYEIRYWITSDTGPTFIKSLDIRSDDYFLQSLSRASTSPPNSADTFQFNLKELLDSNGGGAGLPGDTRHLILDTIMGSTYNSQGIKIFKRTQNSNVSANISLTLLDYLQNGRF